MVLFFQIQAVVLKLSQSKDDFDYEIDSDLGNVEFDGISVENSVICNKASGKMKNSMSCIKQQITD